VPAREQELNRFDLDFPGGTAHELAKAIQKQPAKRPGGDVGPNPLNLIVASDSMSALLPPIRVENVTVADLFEALGKISSRKNERVYTFSCQGFPHNSSVWTFSSPVVDTRATENPQSECRFYELAPYLETYKVEDITTVVETAWKMLGETSMPRMEFHKETKLLIVVGRPNQLQVIDDALSQLAGGGVTGGGDPVPAGMSQKMIKRYHLDQQGHATNAPASDADQRFFERYGVQRRKPATQPPGTNDAPAVKP
jgi:hypothetical protein